MSRPIRLIAVLLICAVLLPASGSAFLSAAAAAPNAPPTLGRAAPFAVLGGSTVTNTGSSVVIRDLGVSPGTATTGFPPGSVNGTIHSNDTAAQNAQTDATAAYNTLAALPCSFDLTGQGLGGKSLIPGVYCFDTSAQLTGALTLDALNDPAAVWVFKIGSTLTTASNSSVSFVNGGSACNVFWQIGTSATLGTSTAFIGNILADQSITLNTSANIVSGRALARKGAVTLDTNHISAEYCTPPPTAVGLLDLRADRLRSSPIGLGAGAGLLLAVGLIVIRRRAPAPPKAAPSARQGDGK
jgi:hypothetical protein